MANVYISSTYEDLKAYREAASRALQELRHNVRAMEAYVASDQRPVDKCLDDVDWCTFYVGIFAWRYGFVPPDNNADQRSITELEFRRAVDQGKDCLIFLLRDTAPWSPPLMDATTGAGERGARIANLRQELARTYTCSFFATPDELARLVTAAITIALDARNAADIDAERRERELESERQSRREGQRVVGLRVFDAGTLFRDRVQYREQLGRLLAEPATRMVSVIGRPGIGKTALAATVLADLEQGRWPHTEQGRPVDGIAYFNAGRERLTLEALYHDCALMLGGTPEADLRTAWRDSRLSIDDKVERLLHALECGLYVVLLDHLDTLLDGDGRLIDQDLGLFVERALLSPRRTRLLLTSRAPIATSSQVRPFHRHVMLDEGLPTGDGIALLRDLDPDGILGLRDLPDTSLGRAVERLHGVPRALELLVALVQRDVFLGLDEILEEFYRSPDVLNELVRAAFQRLNADELLVVNILAVLARPVKKHAVEFMVRPFTPGLAVDRVLSDLVHSRMARLERDTALLSLNAIDHDYALGELPADGHDGRRALERQAAAYYATLESPRSRWRSLLDVEPQLLQVTHLIRASEFEAAATVLAKVDVEFVVWTGGIGRVQTLLQELDGKIQAVQLQAALHYRRGQVHTFLGPFSSALARLADAEALARQAGDPELERLVVGWRGEIYRRLGRIDEAVQHLERAAGIYEKDDGPLRDYFALSLSLAYSYQGRPTTATWWAERIRTLIAKHDQETTYTGQVENCLALAALVARRFQEAADYARRAIDCYQTIDAHDPRGYVTNVWGMALLSLGRTEEAIARFRDIRDEKRDARIVGLAAFNMARAYGIVGDRVAAREAAGAAAEILASIEAPQAGAARAFVRAIDSAADRVSRARALMECARGTAKLADVLSPGDLLSEVVATAEAEGLADLAADAKALQAELDSLTAPREK